MKLGMTRRFLLGGLMSGVASVALGEAPLRSLRPVARASSAPRDIPRIPPRARPGLKEIIAQARLDGTVGCALADANTGELLESSAPLSALPPASVTKVLTALYALDALGGAHRFETRIIALGDIEDGILGGNLIFAGGGDPTLSADDLAWIVADIKAAGIETVTGDLLCWHGALPYAEEIEPSQMDHFGYNPAVSGLNLNYNRVYFEWSRVAGNWRTTMDGRTETVQPIVSMAHVRVVDRAAPVFTAEGPDRWTVARSALGDGGSRWLPVRQPALYAGDVLRALASDAGVTLPVPKVIDELPDGGSAVVTHRSASLRTILQEMLLYSTNLTAEVCGLAATRARLGRAVDIEASAAEMTSWLGETYGIVCDCKDHSGLSDQTRISAAAMLQVLLQEGPKSDLRPILRRIPMRDDENRRVDDYPTVVRAKTGTLNFVSTLAGFVKTSDGADLAFVIFSADVARRERGKASGQEIPEGSAAWNDRAKRLQQVLLQRWGLIHRGGGRTTTVPDQEEPALATASD